MTKTYVFCRAVVDSVREDLIRQGATDALLELDDLINRGVIVVQD